MFDVHFLVNPSSPGKPYNESSVAGGLAEPCEPNKIFFLDFILDITMLYKIVIF
jgi:hypothetical protein